jgi:hypothetical protein
MSKDVLSLLIIFKGKHMNTGWLPPETSSDWYFAVSKNSWTLNEIGLQ